MISISVLLDMCVAFVITVIKALLVYLIGKWLISRILGLISKTQFLAKLDASASNYLLNAAKGVLYIVLGLAVINVLGVETSSVLAILASVGVAVGLALQGALSNLVGGIMLLVYRPFNVGDYISASGAEGTVKDITLFYTQIHTVDNVRISVPNGALMDTNVSNFSAEKTRRVDLTFNLAKDEDVDRVVG
ncbi:MAG: mechanosensitive ion channel, partial [Solobacterium sp.]|nr:mechanosensitive ion channel [Solobacterium sp.]